jgi:hypothetical protein
MCFSRQHFERVAEFLPQLPRGGLNAKGASPVSSPLQPVVSRAQGGADRSGYLFPVSSVR